MTDPQLAIFDELGNFHHLLHEAESVLGPVRSELEREIAEVRDELQKALNRVTYWKQRAKRAEKNGRAHGRKR